MAKISEFNLGETVICWRNVKDTTTGQYKTPSGSFTVTITGPAGIDANNKDMIQDSTGHFHYNYTPTVTATVGIYEVSYKAIDNDRVTIATARFLLM